MEQTEPDCPKPYGQDDSCDFNPEFAVICSFIQQFGPKIDLELNIEQLKLAIEDQTNLNESLIDIHVKLLKKIRRYFVRDQWEKALIRFALEYSYEDAYELESLGYLKTRPSIKLQLLRRLLDAQFECDQKFKSSVNLDEASQLRLAPTGRDIKGNTYWHQYDAEGNLRVFQEGPLDYKSWKTICKNSNELKQLLDNLEQIKDEKVKAEPMQEPYHPLPEIFPELFQTKQETAPEKSTQVDANRKTNGKGGKRGKGRGRWKKSITLDPVKEEEEQSIESYPRNHDTNHKQDLELLPEESTISQSSTIVPKLCSSPDNGSIESQVSRTMECLLDRVVSTFEFILKPLSRNFTNNHDNIEANEPKTKPRKKQTKRDKPQPEVLPRRSSSRIQQLQQKKEEEVKKRIDSRKADSFDQDSSNSCGRNDKNNLKERPESPELETKKGKRGKKDRQRWRHGKGKKKLSWDKDDSDLSDTSSLTESNDEDDELDLSNEKLDYDNNNDDDEFACEEEDTNNEPVIIKRARTARQIIEEPDETGELNTSSILEEDKPCGRCDKSNDPEWILLCDMCDDGYHTSCCLPPLMIVPDGDWFCPSCEHRTLLGKLNEFYKCIVEIEEAKERERQRKQRYRKKAVKKDEIDELTIAEPQIPEKRQRDFLHELNDPIALQQLDEELSGDELPKTYRERSSSKPKKSYRKRRSYDDDDYEVYGRRRQKRGRRQISESEESDEAPSSDEYSVSSEDRPKVRRARACVSYQFKEYDELIKSAIQEDTEPAGPNANEYEDDDVDEDEDNDEGTPEGGNYGRGKDMATIEALAYQQENGLIIQTEAGAEATDGQEPKAEEPKTGRGKNRKKGRRLNDLDAGSEIDSATSDESFQASSATEEEEEEEEDEDDTEIDSEDDSSIDEIIALKHRRSRSNKKKGGRRRRRRSDSYESESDFEPRTRRRAQNRVSYKESSDEDEEDFLVERRKAKKTVLSSDEDTEASWKSSKKSDADENEDNDEAHGPDDNESTSSAESIDELVSEVASSQTSKKEDQVMTEAHVTLKTKANENGDAPMGVKRIRLEKRETRPVYKADLINESIDEITLPTSPPKLAPEPAPKPAPKQAPKQVPKPASKPSLPRVVPTIAPRATPPPRQPVPVRASILPQPAPRPSTPPQLNRQPAPLPPHHSMMPHSTGPLPSTPGSVPYPTSHVPHAYLSPIPGPPHQPYMTPHMYPPPPSPYGQPHGPPHGYHHAPHPPPPHQTHMSPLPPQHSPYPPPPSPYHQYNTYMGPNGPFMAAQPMLRPGPPPPQPPPRPPPHQVMSSSINDLNQYCNGPAYPSNIFSSFNMSLQPKNQSPVRPSFYEEDEVRSKSTSAKGKQKTVQKTS